MPGEPREADSRVNDVDVETGEFADGGYTAASSAWLAAVIEDSADAILSKTLDGIIMSWSAGAERLFGYSAQEAIGQPITIIIPKDRLHEEETIIGRLRAGERITGFETVRERKDGTPVDISLTVSPVRDSNGRIMGASKIARDITALKRATERQDLLLRETMHRIKNLFALATALVTISARGASTVEDLAADLIARFHSLSQAHLLAMLDLAGEQPAEMGITKLSALLQTILAPHDGGPVSRITIEGADTTVGTEVLPTIAMVLHELATNAAKYGALAEPNGRLAITIAIAGECLQIRWSETGAWKEGNQPTTKGFGSKLEKMSMAGLQGKIGRTWHDHGVEIRLDIPLDSFSR